MTRGKDYRLGLVEAQFADIVWENEPLSSRELVELCLDKLEWKKSTTYTVLKKFCDREIFQNQNGTVTSLLSKKEFYALQSEQVVEESFDGSLPAFVAAFTRNKKLTEKEIQEIQKLIDASGEK
ncbi:MAG: BlaI/MecI/CopY family transcriptional regulator [Agathobacter sp.]|nr:BlaI/MecI/CopY family transcriptional regulator [Agathobacter sp.]